MAADLENVVRAAGRALGAGDYEEFLTYLHPDVEFTSMIAEMEGETFRGHEGVARWWAQVREAFEEGHWDYQSIEVDGGDGGDDDRGVARLHISGRLGGVPVSQTMWQAFRGRDGKAVWWRFFRSDAEARAAVGM